MQINLEEAQLMLFLLNKFQPKKKSNIDTKNAIMRKINLDLQSRRQVTRKVAEEIASNINANNLNLYTTPMKARGYQSVQLRKKEPPKMKQDVKNMGVDELMQLLDC